MIFPDEFLLPGERSVRWALLSALRSAGFDFSDGDGFAGNGGESLRLPQAERVCFLLVDGLGLRNLQDRSGHARTLRSLTSLEPLTSVVPSTTATAITALGTTAEAGQTSMLGYSLRSPYSGRPFSLIQWDDEGLDPRAWQTVPTLFERLGEQAGLCRAVQPSGHIHSGLSLCALRGMDSLPAETAGERVAAACQAFEQGARFVYLYWGDVDKNGHRHGWTSQAWIEALEELDRTVADLLHALPAGTLLVITADHGMLDVGERIDMDDFPELRRDIRMTAGEERAVQAYTDRPDEVCERWANILGERALVLTQESAEQAGLFGEMTEQARERGGDVFAFLRGRWALLDRRSRLNPQFPLQRGVHGSLTEYEMLVPFLADMV
ncbi:MAG: alkaline phosphatase family protein [Actinomycetaceae bacterium]|nr:alkaline phosphatase family protein [Actinomycetaceae bacterium]